VLDDVIATDRNLAVKVKIEGASKYRVQFIGRGGQILTEVTEPSGWLSCTVISPPAPDGVNTNSCLVERF
jgi:hypothetical protein